LNKKKKTASIYVLPQKVYCHFGRGKFKKLLLTSVKQDSLFFNELGTNKPYAYNYAQLEYLDFYKNRSLKFGWDDYGVMALSGVINLGSLVIFGAIAQAESVSPVIGVVPLVGLLVGTSVGLVPFLMEENKVSLVNCQSSQMIID
jgi:hypothetical protein